jgi:hypothetical protein
MDRVLVRMVALAARPVIYLWIDRRVDWALGWLSLRPGAQQGRRSNLDSTFR